MRRFHSIAWHLLRGLFRCDLLTDAIVVVQGSEFTDGPPLGVSAQVKRLIDEAQDPHKLAVLFPGWQPWV